ncbi:putative exported protein [Salmonella bongori NCTC 12419]|uniref:Putative exported protein n=1 Tax=Salmonella bongori (strain ATCC 43975 / DSM 13772 / NCTC 12419) TaxID=218493 RepID=A0A0K0HB17_SALBC|nr:putative exported protein [Salmonella bongori NCTC 12419]
MRISKTYLIICSLLSAAVPISVSADSATVGILSSPTAPSVGHRPSSPLSDYSLNLNGDSGYAETTIPIPGMLLKSGWVAHVRDPDTEKYQANETATTVCTYYRVTKDNSLHELLREKPCKYKMSIGEDDVGSKIRIDHYNETDTASASGYSPVPSVSERHTLETKRIVKLSPDLSAISTDKTSLMPGESAVVTIIIKDINNSPINIKPYELKPAHGLVGNWATTGGMKAGSNPGEYIDTITYKGGSSRGSIRLGYKYFGMEVKSGLSISGVGKSRIKKQE